MPDLSGNLTPEEKLKIALGLHPTQQPNPLAGGVPQNEASNAPPALGGGGQPAPVSPMSAPAAPTKPVVAAPVQPAATALNVPKIGAQRQADETELQRLNSTGSGVSQLAQRHPILGTMARVGSAIGSAMFPSIASAIPGTELHHSALVNRAQGNVNQDIEGEKATAGLAETEARTGQANAAAYKDLHPQTEGKTPEEQTIHDLMTGENGQPRVNPETGKPYSYLEAYQAVAQSKQDAKPVSEDQKLLTDTGTKPEQLNAELTRRWNALHPNQALPADLQMSAQSKVADYKRADSALKSEEGVEGTVATRNATQQQRNFENTRQTEHDKEQREQKAKADYDKNLAPIESATNFADTYVNSGSYSGSNDDALMLQYFELAKPGTGFRLTNSEMQRQNQAQSWRNSWEAKVNHALHGTWFSDEQRKQIVESMHELAKAKKRAFEMGPQVGGAPSGGGGEQVVEYERGPDGKLRPKQNAQAH